ncbi:MAG: hypothetical protein JXR81_10825 [Candidatus Goldbacteria bacterium]|nr:hypothetical protein [Candidatus Goldiibacteriota bacterium]
MELSRETLKKAQVIVINGAEPQLESFLADYYTLKSLKDEFDSGSALFYSEELTESEVKGNPCAMLWSKKNISKEVKEAAGNKIIIEGRDIKEDYIMFFLSQCGV